jgi:hypothetical protein
MINGITGFNRAGTSTNLLLAGIGNDIANVANATGYNLNLNDQNKIRFTVFLDRVFFQNYSERPKTSDGVTWNYQFVGRTMISKFIKSIKSQSRVYLGFCKFADPQTPLDTNSLPITFPNRVFYSDLYVANNLTWGIEWGRNGNTTAGSSLFTLSQPLQQDFIASNIKVGDPLVITSGDSTLVNTTYYVKNIKSNFMLEMTQPFPTSASNLHFWVGGNWFDVGADDNDSISGLSENSGNLVVSKLFSLFTYNGTSLRQVPDALGTSSQESMLVTKSGLFYFHGSDPLLTGIYKFDGNASTKVSRQVDPYFRGMNSSWYDDVAGWREGDELRWYIDTLSNNNYNISMNNGVATLNTTVNGWDISPIRDRITCSASFMFGNENKYYCGNDEGQVLKMSTGNTFNTDPISFTLESKVFYPGGTETINDFPRIQVVGRATKGVRVKYKLWDKPKEVDEEWWPLGQLDDDKTELTLPMNHKMASGIQLKFENMDTLENDTYIEKATIFYRTQMTRLI